MIPPPFDDVTRRRLHRDAEAFGMSRRERLPRRLLAVNHIHGFCSWRFPRGLMAGNYRAWRRSEEAADCPVCAPMEAGRERARTREFTFLELTSHWHRHEHTDTHAWIIKYWYKYLKNLNILTNIVTYKDKCSRELILVTIIIINE